VSPWKLWVVAYSRFSWLHDKIGFVHILVLMLSSPFRIRISKSIYHKMIKMVTMIITFLFDFWDCKKRYIVNIQVLTLEFYLYHLLFKPYQRSCLLAYFLKTFPAFLDFFVKNCKILRPLCKFWYNKKIFLLYLLNSEIDFCNRNLRISIMNAK